MKSALLGQIAATVLGGNGSADAGTILITADGFAPGTDISNAIPGVLGTP